MSELLSIDPVDAGCSRVVVDDVGVLFEIPAGADEHSDLEMWLIDGDSVHYQRGDENLDETAVAVFAVGTSLAKSPVVTTGLVSRVDVSGFTHIGFKCESGGASTVIIMGVNSRRSRTRSK